MSLAKGARIPNLFLKRVEGTSLELVDLRKKEHALLLLLPEADPDSSAFITAFQSQAKLFSWLNLRLLVAYPRREAVPTPWPAPGYPPFVYAEPLPLGLVWGHAYVISKNSSVIEVYHEPRMLSAAKLEQDMLYWEAGHCLQ